MTRDLRSEGFCHDGDRRPDTLSFRPTEDGRSWEPHCFKGCERDVIVRKLLEAGELPRTDGPVADWTVSRTDKRGRPAYFDDAEHKVVIAEHEALRARHDLVAYLERERRITEEVIRSEFVGWRAREKRIVVPFGSPFAGDQRRVYQRDRWQAPAHRRNGAPKVLAETGRARWLYYPAPWMVKDGWANLCEGATDALAVVSAGLPAIGMPSGTAWNASWTAELKRLGVGKLYVPADRDDTGEKAIARVRAALEPSGIKVVPVELPGLDEHGDVTDFLRGFARVQQGGKALRQLCEDAEPKPDGLEVIWASAVRLEPVFPLLRLRWGYRVPLGMLTLLGGREDIGKTTTACQIVADVSNGELGTPGRKVLVFTSEDSANSIGRRLLAAGADMDKVAIVKRVRRDGQWHGFRIPRDVDYAEKLIREEHPALIVFVGSLMAHFESARTNTHRTTDMREALEPINDLAERYSLAALAVVHPNKNRHSDVAMAISESAALIQTARSAMWLDWEDESRDQRVIAHFKHNESTEEIGLTYRMVVEDLGNGLTAGRMERTGATKLTANELYARRLQSTSGDGRISKSELAKNLLEVLLGDHEPHPVQEIKAALAAATISESTCEKVKRELGVETSHDKSVPPKHFWAIPDPFKRADPSPANEPDGTGGCGTGGTAGNGSVEPNSDPLAVQSRTNAAVDGTGPRRPRQRPGGPISNLKNHSYV